MWSLWELTWERGRRLGYWMEALEGSERAFWHYLTSGSLKSTWFIWHEKVTLPFVFCYVDANVKMWSHRSCLSHIRNVLQSCITPNRQLFLRWFIERIGFSQRGCLSHPARMVGGNRPSQASHALKFKNHPLFIHLKGLKFRRRNLTEWSIIHFPSDYIRLVTVGGNGAASVFQTVAVIAKWINALQRSRAPSSAFVALYFDYEGTKCFILIKWFASYLKLM